MEENPGLQQEPYSAIVGTIGEIFEQHTQWPWQLGEVISVDPLAIRTGGHDIPAEKLWVNYQLRENEEDAVLDDVSGTLYGKTDCETGNASTFTFDRGTLEVAGTFLGVLEPGDKVVLLVTRDGQGFAVLCKVVDA